MKSSTKKSLSGVGRVSMLRQTTTRVDASAVPSEQSHDRLVLRAVMTVNK